MGKTCVVPTCRSGYRSCPDKVSMFAVPKDRLIEWQNAIGRPDRPLSIRDSVCEKHFGKNDVIRVVETESYTYKLAFPKLSKTAIPTILLPTSKYQFRPRNGPLRKFSSNGFPKLRSEDIMFMKNETPRKKQTFNCFLKNMFINMIKRERKTLKNLHSFSKKEYDKLILQILSKKASDDVLKTFSIAEVDGTKKLIMVPNKREINLRFYVHDDELYEILRNAHHALNHSNPFDMVEVLNRTYKNIYTADVCMFVSLCPVCNKTVRKNKKKSEVKKAKPFVENKTSKIECCTELSISCLLSIIDYQSSPDGEFKFILIYQNVITKYYILKSLRSTNSDELYTVLIDIFSFIGAPSIIQSEIDDDVIRDIQERIMKLWPTLQITHIRLEDYQKNECHKLIEEHLDSWMEYNETSKWTNGLRFVQMILNNEYDQDLNKSPYEVIFNVPTNDEQNENVNGNTKMVNERDDNSINELNEHVLKEEPIEIFSFICDVCGNDNGNEQVCSICQRDIQSLIY